MIEALRSAYAQVAPADASIEIVVVDNSSTDSTVEAIGSLFPTAKLIRTHKNLGCPGGRNILYANCTGDIIINLDDDGQLAADVVTKTIAMFQQHPRAAVIAFKQVEHSRTGVEMETPRLQSNFSGGLSAFRREAIEKVGLYPDDFFLLAEEENLALRIIDAGFDIIYAPYICMIHSFEQESTNPKFAFFMYRNTLLNVVELFPAAYVAPYFFGRCLRNFRHALEQRTVAAWARGSISAIALSVFRGRKPVSVRSIRYYLNNRLTWKIQHASKTRR